MRKDEKRFIDYSSAQGLIDDAWGLTAEEGAYRLRQLWLDYASASHIHYQMHNDFSRKLLTFCRARVRVFLDAYRGLTPRAKDMEIVG